MSYTETPLHTLLNAVRIFFSKITCTINVYITYMMNKALQLSIFLPSTSFIMLVCCLTSFYCATYHLERRPERCISPPSGETGYLPVSCPILGFMWTGTRNEFWWQNLILGIDYLSCACKYTDWWCHWVPVYLHLHAGYSFIGFWRKVIILHVVFSGLRLFGPFQVHFLLNCFLLQWWIVGVPKLSPRPMLCLVVMTTARCLVQRFTTFAGRMVKTVRVLLLQVLDYSKRNCLDCSTITWYT